MRRWSWLILFAPIFVYALGMALNQVASWGNGAFMPETLVKAGQEQFKYYPYSSIFHLTRNSFYTAGQDSFTQAPAQDPDLFEVLNNVEPVVQGTLQRRRGYTLFSAALTRPSVYQRSYAFRSESLGLRRYVWSSATGVDATDEQGRTILSPVFNTVSAAQFPPRMVLSRDYGYFTDGSSTDNVKWNGTNATLNLTNWGIAVNSTSAAPTGPNNTGTGSNVANDATATPWSNPTNIQGAPDGVFASVNLLATGCTASADGCYAQNLQASNFGFSIPGSAGGITGIQVAVKGFMTCTGCQPPFPPMVVGILKAGVLVGPGKLVLLPGTNQVTTLGGLGDLWGSSFQASDINASGFGVVIYNANTNGATSANFNIDSIQVTVYTSGGGLAFTTSTATTNIVLLSGRTYYTAFQNSNTGHTSSLSPPSLSTGPLVGNQVNLTNIPVSTDPQVTTTLVLATLDGNDQTTLYLVASLPNGTTTFTDTIPDSFTASYTVGPTLLTSAIYQNTDVSGLLHGIANNNPPPTGLNFPTKHKGRLYGSVGRVLYFSKNLDEIITANGLVTAKWEESWPFTNQFDISETAETIQGLLSDGETLWIGTERAIRRLVGDSPSNFQEPEIQFNETGLLTQDVWKVVFYEGQPVGTIWVTPDFRVMASDFNTYQDIGKPIQDVLNSITQDGTGLYNCHASFVSQGPFDLYMLYLSTNGSDFPNVVCVYNLRTKTWGIWNPTDQISTSLFNINVSGVPQWLFAANGTQGGPLYFWDQTTRQDRTGNTPITYPTNIRTSWLNMGDEGLIKALNQQIVYTADQALTLKVEGAIVQGNLIGTPTTVLAATPVTIGPLGGYLYVPLAHTASKHYWYRFTWTSPPSTQQVVLGAYNTEIIPVARV